MHDYIRLNWSVEGQEPGTLVFEDNASGRLEAAKVFVEQVALPGLRYVEGWRCWGEQAGAERLWEFSPYFPAGTGGIAAQPPESGVDGHGVAVRWVVETGPIGKIPGITAYSNPVDALAAVGQNLNNSDVHLMRSALWAVQSGRPFTYETLSSRTTLYPEKGTD